MTHRTLHSFSSMVAALALTLPDSEGDPLHDAGNQTLREALGWLATDPRYS